MRRLALLCALTILSGTALSGCADLGGGGPGRRYVVFFTKGSLSVDPAADRIIHAAAATAQQYPDQSVTVAGFAANHGDPDADQALSVDRAALVAKTLRSDGVAWARITQQPRAPSNEDPSVGARRVEITIGAAP